MGNQIVHVFIINFCDEYTVYGTNLCFFSFQTIEEVRYKKIEWNFEKIR